MKKGKEKKRENYIKKRKDVKNASFLATLFVGEKIESQKRGWG